ncbi:NACHT domain-containing protein [Streptomyces sp. NPDC005529]
MSSSPAADVTGDGLKAELLDLYAAVGTPPLERLVEASEREGRPISKTTVHNILKGVTRPRLSTVESFAAACVAHARNRRPRIELSPDQVDLDRWRRLFFGPAPALRRPPDAPSRELAVAVAAHFAALMEHQGLPSYIPAGLAPGVIDQVRKVSPLHPALDKTSAYDRSWEKSSARHTRIVLLADAGMGKSWLLGMHAHRMAEAALHALCQDNGGSTPRLPLALRCDQLTARPEANLPLAVSAHLAGLGVIPDTVEARDTLARWVTEGRTTLLLDAYDELADLTARTRLRTLLHTAPAKLPIVVSGRQAGYTGPPAAGAIPWQELLLEPFGEAEINAVVGLWPLPPGARDVLADRVNSPQLSGLAQVPLLLALLCALASEATPRGGLPVLPLSRGALYERILRRFLIHEHRPPAAEDTDADRLLGLLGPLAFRFAITPEGWQDVMRRDAVLDAIEEVGAPTTLRQDAASLLRLLSVEAGVLQPMGDPSAGRDAPYLFAHRSFGEYLTARHLSGLPEIEVLEIVDARLAQPGRWQDTLALLGRLVWLRRGPARFERLLIHLLDRRRQTGGESLLYAIRMLGDFGDTRLELAATLLDDLALEFRLLASGDLERAVRTAAGCACLPDQIIDALSDVLSEDLDNRVHKTVALAHHTQQSVTDLLIKAATGDVFDGRRFRAGDSDAGRAVEALTHRPGADVLRALLIEFRDVSWAEYIPENGIPHWSAVDALRARRDPAALAPVIAAATEGPLDIGDVGFMPFRVRSGALKVLGGYPDDAATKALLRGAADPNARIREVAISGLEGRRTTAVRAAVTAVVQEEGYLGETARRVAATLD